MIIDSHLHTLYSHGTATVDEMVKKSIEKGLENIAFSEHFIYDYFSEKGVPTVQGGPVDGTSLKKFKQYCQDVNKASKVYKNKIQVRLGVEVDFIKRKEKEIKKALESQDADFDFIMGAIHFIGKPLKYFPDYAQESWLKDEYFDWLKDSVTSKLFDIIAHPQLIQYYLDIDDREYEPIFERLTDLLKTYEVAIEVNTDFLDSKKIKINPNLLMLKMCKRKNIALVLGSDAHSPEKIGKMFPEAIKILKNIGFEYLYYFEKRKKVSYSI